VRLLDTADGSHIPVEGLADPALDKLIPADRLAELREQADLVQGGYPEFDEEAFLQGTMTPVFFGSALRDFGVGHLLDGLGRLAPPPLRARPMPAWSRPARRS
jgi:peptide chain release factor 3